MNYRKILSCEVVVKFVVINYLHTKNTRNEIKGVLLWQEDDGKIQKVSKMKLHC